MKKKVDYIEVPFNDSTTKYEKVYYDGLWGNLVSTFVGVALVSSFLEILINTTWVMSYRLSLMLAVFVGIYLAGNGIVGLANAKQYKIVGKKYLITRKEVEEVKLVE